MVLDEIFKYILPTGYGVFYEFNATVDITVISDPEEAGTAEVTQIDVGQYKIESTPGDGYKFDHWEYYKDGVPVISTDPVLILGDGEDWKITEDTTVKLYFSIEAYNITWKSYDGTILQTETVPVGTMPKYKGEEPQREGSETIEYIFDGWEPEFEEVTADVEYTAQFVERTRLYDITWKDDENNVYRIDELEYQSIPNYGAIPEKTSTAQYSYTFDKWVPNIVPVVENTTYQAEFIPTIRTYTVSWKNYDGSILETDENVPYGTTPTYDGETPTKPPTSQYTYTFNGWTPNISPVQKNVIYRAKFTESVNKYTVTWKNYDGTVLERDTNVPYGTTPTYNGAIPIRPSTPQYHYTFSGWGDISPVHGNVSYTAQFSSYPIEYRITTVEYPSLSGTTFGDGLHYVIGDTITLSAIPASGYKFIRWIHNNVTVSTSAEYIFTF